MQTTMLLVQADVLQEIQDKLESLMSLITINREEDYMSELLSPEKAAKMLDVSLRTLQNYRDQGLIDFSQLDRKIWFKREDVLEFIDSMKINKRRA